MWPRPPWAGVSPETFTVEKANQLLPKVQAGLEGLREALRTHRFEVEQVQDLRRMHGDEVEDEGHEAHGTFAEHAEAAEEAKDLVEERRRSLEELGVILRDARVGHVDFPAERGDERVMLCWRDGEEAVTAWHRPEEGIADRRPVGAGDS